MTNSVSILIIGSVWPEPNSSAAGSRMLQLIQLFSENEYRITFASPAQESEFMVNLEAINVEKINISLNSTEFDDFIKKLNPTIVLFDRFIVEEQFGWRVIENCPEAIRILDTEDLHCLRVARQRALKKGQPFLFKQLLTEPLAKREIASILRCDVSLIISEIEISLLKEIFNIHSALLFYLPLFIDSFDEEELINLNSFSNRADFVFIGNFLHEPNWNAVQYLKEKIWPLIRKQLPQVKLKIFGAYPSKKVFELQNLKENFIVEGRAENSRFVIGNARVLLAPLRFGAGIKGKLFEAMHYGTPSITTPIGAEGLNGNFEWNGFIESTPEEFATKAVMLYQNEIVWKESQEKGYIILQNRFLKSAFSIEFIKMIQFIVDNKELHRDNNFLGAMLVHHYLASTKYMSKWIEEKNK